MSTPSAASGMYVVVANTGLYDFEVLADETYNDPAFTWQQADELQADADVGVTYSVYALTPAPR